MISNDQPQSQSPEEATWAALNPITTSPEDLKSWFDRIEKATARRKIKEPAWDILLKELIPVVSEVGRAEILKVNSHFRNVQTKIGQIFVRSPNVQLTPKGPALDQLQVPAVDPLTGQTVMRPATPEEMVPVKQTVLDYFMGPDEIDGVRLMDECLFDNLGYSGISAVKVGYEETTIPYNKPVTQPDPNYIPPVASIPTPTQPPPQVPVIDPLTGKPQTELIQVPIHQRWYADKIPAKKLLFDADLRSTRYQKDAGWIAHETFVDKKMVMSKYGLLENELPASTQDDRSYKHDGDDRDTKDKVKVIEVFYKGYIYSTAINPEVIHQLVLIEGMKNRPALHRMSPDQELDEYGALVPGSFVGFPIKVCALRDLTDSPYPDADSAFTNPQAKELNTYRRQSVKLRDAAIGKYFYDTGAIDEDSKKSMQAGETGDFIGVKEGLLAGGADRIFTTTAQIKSIQDDYRGAAQIKQDMDETLGISANQAGVNTDTVRSATETSTVSQAAAGRQDKEKARAIAFYIEIVRAVDCLVTKYAKGDRYISVAGEDGSRKLMQWNRQLINLPCSYDISSDSMMQMDAATNLQRNLSFYNLVAKDPLVNRTYVLRRLAQLYGFDPFKVILSPEQVAMGTQPPHGGPANKHENEQTSGKPNAPGATNRDERAGQ